MSIIYKIAIGVDHRGYKLKEFLIAQSNIKELQISWQDCGTNNEARTDYPIYAKKVIENIKTGKASLGILACGTGIGMSIIANRYQNIYAGLVWNQEIAKFAKEDDNINILVLPADYIQESQALEIIYAWLATKFKADRYLTRLNMIDNK